MVSNELPQLKKTCTLTRFGYALAKPVGARQKALRKAVDAYGSSYTIKKLVLLRTYMKRQATHAAKLTTDIGFVQRVRDAMPAARRAADKKKKPVPRSYCPSRVR
jgi:hypothetical protein